jgi:peptidoglycan/LPS O-acetylase OafA/YrhL
MAERSGAAGLRKRIPALDGLRAVAISLVLLAHLRATPGFPAWLDAPRFYGGLGIELSFVISGFLITSKLMGEEERSGRIGLGAFYRRRALRILPAALAYLAAVALLGAAGLSVVPLGDIVAALTFCRNLFGDSFLTGHFWTLSVEEQFYLVWPVVFSVVPAGRRLRVALALFALAPLWRTFNLYVLHPPHGLNLGRADLHYDTIVAGILLALARRHPRGDAAQAWATDHGAALLAGAMAGLLMLQVLVPRDWWLTMSARDLLIAAIVLSVVAGPGHVARALLESRPLRWVGRISYSLYLWQQLFTYWWKIGDQWFGRFPANLAGALLVSAASYYLIERPILAWRDRAVGEAAYGPNCIPS